MSTHKGKKVYEEPGNHLVYNAIMTPDGTLLESHHVHDYKAHKDKNGEIYMIDGGLEYIRGSLHKENPPIYLQVYNDDPFSLVRESIRWGSFGVKGDEELRITLLKDMSDDHIKNIIKNITHIPEWRMSLFEDELEYRKIKNITIGD